MTTVFSHAYQSSDRAERPSLFTNSAKPASFEEPFSILSRLEPSRARRRRVWRIVWTTPLLSLVAVAVVIGLNGGFTYLARSIGSAEKSGVGTESMQVAGAGQSHVLTSSTAEPDTAAVASETSFTGEQMQADELASVIAEAAHRTSEMQTGADPATAVVGTAAVVTAHPVSGATSALFSSGSAKARANHPKRAISTPAMNHAKNVKKDKDVELIGALLAHVSAPAGTPASNTSARKQQAVANKETRTAARRDRATSGEENYAAQAAVVSTETLIKQCRSRGILEGELCRLRVCSNLWGKDPACPSSALTASDS